MSFPKAICYAGLPGAGKSSASSYGLGRVGGERVSMGDYIRKFYQEDTDDAADSHSLGEYATEFRERNGQEGLAARMCRGWAEDGFPDDPVHIDGLRCKAGHDVFEYFFGAVPIVFVEAGFYVRLQRMNARGREGEDEFTNDDLLQRDEREAEWGTLDLGSLDETITVENSHGRSRLWNRLDSALLDLYGDYE